MDRGIVFSAETNLKERQVAKGENNATIDESPFLTDLQETIKLPTTASPGKRS